MKVKIKKLSEAAVIPTKAHESDAGFDLICTSVKEDRKHHCVLYGTGIALEIPEGYVGIVSSKNSVFKQDIMIPSGFMVVDSRKRDEIIINYRIMQPHIHRYTVGDSIGTLYVLPLPTIEIEEIC